MSIEGKREAYKTCEAEFDAEIRFVGSVRITTATAFLGATEQYIDTLEKRLIMLELGHEVGLQTLRWLDLAWTEDTKAGMQFPAAGKRNFVPGDYGVLNALKERGYVDYVGRGVWITKPGRDYLKARNNDPTK